MPFITRPTQTYLSKPRVSIRQGLQARLTALRFSSLLLVWTLSVLVPQGAASDSQRSSRDQRWVGAWATGQQLTEPHNNPPEPGLSGNTLRQKVFPTLSGDRVRVSFSNEWGDEPVVIREARLAAAGEAEMIDPATDTPLRFDGQKSVTLQPGELRYSDPVDYQLKALEMAAITLHFGQVPSKITGHPGSRTTSYIAKGDAVSKPSLPVAVTADHWYYISSIDVEAGPDSAAIVAFGDSITDGRGSTLNRNDRWPDYLARRLKQSEEHRSLSVINQGIGGNAVVSGGLGPTALERFERDVLQQPGARWVIVLEGVNDIGNSGDPAVADRLIAAYKQMINAAHEKGLRIYASPILPFGGSLYYNEMHEAARRDVNRWIRESGYFDAVIDLAEVVADPDNPTRLLPKYDSGDNLHLSPAGYQAMADAIDLSLFER